MDLKQKLMYQSLSSPDFHDVGEFHEKFGLDNCTRQMPGPREVSDDLLEFRLKFLLEELREFGEAVGYHLVMDNEEIKFERNPGSPAKIDHEKAFDALIDLNYVSLGTAHLFGYPWPVGWSAVQRANMAKERAKEAKQSARGSTWDVIKPQGWTAPDIKGILRRWGFNV